MNPNLSLHALSAENWDRFERLLGGDEFGGCFCAVWTHFGPDWVERCGRRDRPNLEATRRDLEDGRRPGFLVTDRHGECIAWTGAGPRSEFPRLSERLGARRSKRDDTAWCIGCVAVVAPHRGRGLTAAIIRAVQRAATEAGAPALEAYPVDPWDEPRSYRGALSTYRSLGFVRGRSGAGRRQRCRPHGASTPRHPRLSASVHRFPILRIVGAAQQPLEFLECHLQLGDQPRGTLIQRTTGQHPRQTARDVQAQTNLEPRAALPAYAVVGWRAIRE